MNKSTKEKRPVSLKIIFSAIFLFIISAAVLYLVLVPKRPSFSSLKKDKDFNFIFITVDTLRADRLHCYGFEEIETPTIDLFAERGIMFENCIATTPLTLPSHTSIFTGTLPLYHGVRDNGGFLVPPELDTMAELFKTKDYKTSAFVAAFVLESKWGLDQGFDYYFDNFDLSQFQRISLASVQRPANEVMDEALTWLEENKGDQFFTWIHLYDPHTPYEPPPPFDKKYANRPYAGEIAFTDSQLGRLWDFLESNKLVDNTFLIFTADHGESLGEHRESTHGFFVYQEAIAVPLIFVTPFPELQGLSSSRLVSLMDIMPTVLEMEGLPIPDQVQGESLLPLFFDQDRSPGGLAYSETFYPRFHFGWSELKSVQNERYKLILAPEMELYDLIEDPNEGQNLAASHAGVLSRLSREANDFIEKYSQGALEMDITKIDEETMEKLAALGYIGSFSDSASLEGKELANPKDKIIVFNQLSKAREMGMEGRAEEAAAIIKEIIADDPDIIDAYFSLGNVYFKNGEYEEAIRYFKEALDRKPDDIFTIINIANALRRMEKFDEAEAFIIENLKKGISDSQLVFILGGMKVIQGKDEEAIGYYKETLALNAASAASHAALAMLYLKNEDLVNAEKHVYKVLEINPKMNNAHFNLAQLLEKKGDLSQAKEAYRKELENSPNHFKSSFNLSRLFRKTDQVLEEENYLNRTIEINPDFPMAYFYLARIYLNRGEKYQEAISFVEKGIGMKPEDKDLVLGYFLLADLFNRTGNNAKSLEYAQKGQELVQKISDKP